MKTVLYHHECLDGSGYYGKCGDSIPARASIPAVAAIYDSLTSSCVPDKLPRQSPPQPLDDP